MSDLLTPVLGIPYANGDDPLGNVDVAMGNLAARVEALLTQHAYKAATQQVVSSTTLVDITDLNFAVAASPGTTHRYKFSGVVLYIGNGTGDMKIQLRTPLAAPAVTGCWLHYSTGDIMSISRLQGDVSIAIGADTAMRAVAFNGIYQVTDQVADTARLQFAQNVSNATPTVIQIGSHLFAQRVM